MTNKFLQAPIVVAALFLLHSMLSFAAANDQQHNAITALIKSYEAALNGSDTNKVVQLYANDGVFMPSHKPTSSGQAQVRNAYDHVFNDLDLNVSFHIDEIEQRDDIAFVRTSSDGKITLLKKNITIENNSRELFVVKRIGEKWKIYRYMFNEAG